MNAPAPRSPASSSGAPGSQDRAGRIAGAPPWAFVAAGGALGALLRGGLDAAAAARPWDGAWAVAWSTVVVDLVGALLLGAVLEALAEHRESAALSRLRLLAATGFTGALTTYGTVVVGAVSDEGRAASGARLAWGLGQSLVLLLIGAAAAGWGARLVRWGRDRGPRAARSKGAPEGGGR
ncbi:CrcB family protein [Actinomyces sp. B33]|uniref:CrcB family protein n=1 Tax=Actinomyces sp. B33 TaxID=2942131 RepID=UPI00234255C2|nr:CrcB family protein [Actinomyces sp. B33]MDC4233940.1 CrcB family protein [Actinomyces sp. B33]